MNHRTGTILRVDLTNSRISTESTEPYVNQFIGGRGINVKIAFDEISPEISPFDPDNRLLFGPGVFTGTPVPAASRMEVTTMLPNGLIGSSGIGGFIGAEIKHSGYDNIVIQGKSNNPVYIHIRDDSVEVKDARHLWGLDTWETQQTIKEELNDPDVQILCIGPAGENLVSFSCILTSNHSAAGHGGAGAVMGSKNLKAIAVRGHHPVQIAKMDEFLEACYETRTSIVQNPVRQLLLSGDSIAVAGTLMAGIAVFGNWEHADWDPSQGKKVQEEANEFWSRYYVGNTGCFGCPLRHILLYDVPDIGAGGPKCEAWGAFSTKVWTTDHKLIFHAGHLCNLLGLDVGAAGNAVAFLMELYHKGITSTQDTDGIAMKRGDGTAIVTAIENIAHQKGFGKLFRDGVLEAARKIGKGTEDFVIHVKGRELFTSTEIRGFKMRAFGSAICRKNVDASAVPEYISVGGPNDSAEQLAEELCGSKDAANPDSYELKGRLVWEMENRSTVEDMLGICRHYNVTQMGKSWELACKIFPLITGMDLRESDLLIAAQRVRTLERAFAYARGIRRKDDILPKRLMEEPVSGGPLKGKGIDREKFDQMVDEYYELSGWDQDSMPKKETFKEHWIDI